MISLTRLLLRVFFLLFKDDAEEELDELKKYELTLVMLSERFNLNSVGAAFCCSMEPATYFAVWALTNESGSVNCSFKLNFFSKPIYIMKFISKI